MSETQIEMIELGDVAEFVRGINFKPDDVVSESTPGVVACMRTKNVQAELDQSDVWFVGRQFVKRKEQMLSHGDILISSANSWNLVGKCCWIPDLPWESTFGGFVTVLRANRNKAFPRYLYHWFSSPNVQDFARSFGRQTTNISNLDISRCLKMPIPLPPLSEQKRIAEILDGAEALRSKRRAALALLDELTQSIFLDMFGDPVSNPKGWDDSRTLADVASIGSGITKGRRTSEPVRAVPYLAVVNVQDKMLDLSVVKTIEATEKEIDRYRLKKNDLLLTEGGDADKLGRGTLWNDELSECIHQNHIFRVRLTTNDVAPLFLNWLVGGQRGKSYFLSQAKQTTGIATINMTQLKAFPMLIPSRKLQDDFAKRILRIEDIRSSKMSSLNELDQLFASLQHRAFRGEL